MRRVIFYHIPKCAGMSVAKVLEKSYPKSVQCPFRTRDLHSRKEYELRQYMMFSGHYTPRIARKCVDANYVEAILLRNPVDRIISLYNYLQLAEDHGMRTTWPFIPFESAKCYSFEEFLFLEKKRLTNAMCKQLVGAGIRGVDLVTEAFLQTCAMDVVGVVEEGIGTFLWKLSEKAGLDWDGKIPHENQHQGATTEVTPKAMELLTEITEGDMVLYRTVKETCYEPCA